MTWLVYGLFATAVAVLVAAEWPRLIARLSRAPLVGRYAAKMRRRKRRRAHLVLVEDDEADELAEDREAFAESVVRDLERLPTIDDRD